MTSPFQNPPDAEIADRLRHSQTVAVIGVSPDRSRPSHGVAAALDRLGYQVTGVRPGTDRIRDFPVVPELAALPDSVDLAVVFRRHEHAGEVVDQALEAAVPALWFQEGAGEALAARRAREAGLFVVMDRCIYRDGIPLLQAGA